MKIKRIRGVFHGARLVVLRFGAVAVIAVFVHRANAPVEQVQSVVDMVGMRMSAGAMVSLTAVALQPLRPERGGD
jgi:hypothetical protein